VRFEPFSEDHLPFLETLTSDPDTLRFTRLPDPPPPGFTRRWVERYAEGRRNGTHEALVVVDDDGTFLGLALVPEIDRDAREAELGYMVAPDARGRGVATAILRHLTAWAFEQGVLRATLIIDVENAASERVAARCGYVREGVMRSLHVKGDVRADCSLWSRLPSD
jgi:RimJ/RimL family protein N-acetyltransferase